MIPNTYSVCPGVTLRALQTDRFKSGMLSVSASLPITRAGTPLTSLLLAVLRRGTEHYPTLADLNRRLDYLYGTELSIRNFYRADRQIIGLSAELIDASYLPNGEDLTLDALRVMCEILFCPQTENGLLCSRYVESEKQMQCDAIRAQKNEPRPYASDRAREILFSDEPCGAPILGTEEQIAATDAAALTAHYKAILKELTWDCFYVGSSDPARIADALRQTLGRFVTPSTHKPLIRSASIRRADTVKRIEEALPVSQGHLILAYRTGAFLSDPAFYACAVCNEILGQSPVSKLFVHVRERLSLCYFCSSHYNSYKGSLMIHCGLDPANRARAESEILAQVHALQQGDFTDAELDAAKRSLCSAYRQLSDSPTALESFYFGRALMGVKTTAEESLDAIRSVTRADILAAAQALTLDTVYFLNGTLSGEEDEDDDEADLDD